MLLLEMQWTFTAKPPTDQQQKICSTKMYKATIYLHGNPSYLPPQLPKPIDLALGVSWYKKLPNLGKNFGPLPIVA